MTRSIDPVARTSRCDEIVGHVIATLLDNGLRASSDLGSVHAFATVEDGWVRIIVSDQGKGIPEPLRERVFEAGFTTRRAEGGLGIGLTVSREILEGLGGSLDLSPGVEGGTRATIRVPCQSAQY